LHTNGFFLFHTPPGINGIHAFNNEHITKDIKYSSRNSYPISCYQINWCLMWTQMTPTSTYWKASSYLYPLHKGVYHWHLHHQHLQPFLIIQQTQPHKWSCHTHCMYYKFFKSTNNIKYALAYPYVLHHIIYQCV